MRPDYVTKSPEESRRAVALLASGMKPAAVVSTLIGRPEQGDIETPLRPAPARAASRRAPSAPANRAAGAIRTVVGAPAQLAQEGTSDTALSRLFAAVVVGALTLELGSLISGKFFNISTGAGSPFPLQIRPSAGDARVVVPPAGSMTPQQIADAGMIAATKGSP